MALRRKKEKSEIASLTIKHRVFPTIAVICEKRVSATIELEALVQWVNPKRKLDNRRNRKVAAMHTMVLFKEFTSKLKGYLSNGVRMQPRSFLIKFSLPSSQVRSFSIHCRGRPDCVNFAFGAELSTASPSIPCVWPMSANLIERLASAGTRALSTTALFRVSTRR